jgi:hypothetical protein
MCSLCLDIFIFFLPKIPFFVPEKRPKNAFFVQKRDGKCLFSPKDDRETASETPRGL